MLIVERGVSPLAAQDVGLLDTLACCAEGHSPSCQDGDLVEQEVDMGRVVQDLLRLPLGSLGQELPRAGDPANDVRIVAPGMKDLGHGSHGSLTRRMNFWSLKDAKFSANKAQDLRERCSQR